MKTAIMLAALGLLAGCAGGAPKQAEIAYYDLGIAPRITGAQAVPLRTIDVQAPSWLGTPGMQYRLAYADGSRRDAYAESRWAAPPAELLEVALRRRIASGESEMSSAGCKLRIDLDEFAQVFDSPTSSKSVVDARVMLLAAKSDQLLARRALSLSRPAATPDARGGVAAFAGLTTDISSDVAFWLVKMAKENPGLVERCR